MVTRKVLVREFIEVLVMGLIGVVFNLVLYDVSTASLVISASIWIVLSKGNGYIVDLLNQKISWVNQPVLRVTIGMIAMMVYTIIAFGAVIIGWNWFFFDIAPVEMLRKIEADDFTFTILITLIISMFFHGRAFYLNWKEALLREEKLKNESLKSQYESLKNQVNPHFLFNSLNVLSSLVYDDQEKAIRFIRKMSDVYRYVLDKKDQELVTLDEELDFLSNYVYLQKIRFGDNLCVKIDRKADGYVPPLALQLLVENAIKHNVVSEARPLHIAVVIDHDTISVKNNLQEKLTKDSTGIGLSNLRARYGYLSDNAMEIVKTEAEFEVVMPLLKLAK